jgi:2-oxoglutarate ferredoxin oxidoreductase subunit beta
MICNGKYDHFTPEWCPGCGNFDILDNVKQALCDLGIEGYQVLLSTGIGQTGKLGFSVKANMFNAVHGRTLPLAMGMKMANHEAKVLAIAGDADFYSEGGNHLIHNLRRNLDVTILVGDNRVFGLTKGQATPTAASDYRTTTQVHGPGAPPLRPTLLALGAGATFVAKAYCNAKEECTDIIKQGIRHRGAAFIDIMFPCVTWNHLNTYQWFRERARPIGPEHDRTDFESALKLAALPEDGLIWTGVYYQVERLVFGDHLPAMQGEPIVKRTLRFTPERVRPVFEDYK